uniref:Uncharacterized protein n=1 Tax=Zea mays TaxID=4577 RepID=C0PN89_MAIZE|nr:unknown [Zea mays]
MHRPFFLKLELACLQRMGLLGNCTEAKREKKKHDPDQSLDSLGEALLMELDIIQLSVLTV